MADLSGQTIGNYRVTERLGRGGMADVYKAFHPGLSVYRAIKVIRPEFVTSDDFRVRFQKEAQSVAALRHPNIVQVHDFGSEGNAYYMVMEFIEGQDLKHLIQTEGRIRPIGRALHIVRQIASALDYAHGQSVIHRDIKPENIMLNAQGLPILMDFGIARLLTSNTRLTQTGMGIGTPAYMAPEQAMAEGEIGPAADIYSLSIVLFEMLTGKAPFTADTPMAVMLKAINDPLPMPRTLSDDIGDEVEQIILKGTAKQPQLRFATAGQFEQAILDVMDTESDKATAMHTRVAAPVAAREAAPPSNAKPVGKSRSAAMLAGVLVLLALTGGGYLLLSREVPDAPAVAVAPVPVPAPAPTPETTATVMQQQSGPVDTAAQASHIIAQHRGATPAGKALTFDVQAAAGDIVYLDVIMSKPATDFSLTSPDGRKEIFRNYSDSGPVTLEQPGTYTLAALTRNDKPGNVDFQLWQLNPAVINGGAIAAGTYIDGATRAPGQSVDYRYQANAGDVVFFDVDRTSETTDFRLLAPDGRTEIFENYSDQGPVELPQDGVYRLTADPRGDRVSAYTFALYNIDPPVLDGGAIHYGKYIAGQTRIPGQIVEYSLEVKAGSSIFFDLNKTSNTVDFGLTQPDGRNKVFESYNDSGPLQLDTGGTWKLQANPRGDKTAEYDFVMWLLDPPVIDGGELGFGEYITASVNTPGQVLSYRFVGKTGQHLFFDKSKTSTTVDFTLLAPDGRTELKKNYDDIGPVELTQTGAWQLTADPRGDKTADMEFTLFDVNPLVIDGGVVQPGKFITGETVVPGQTVSYRFTGSAGQKISFEADRVAERTHFVMLAPDGRNRVFETWNKTKELALPADGEYTLTVSPAGDKVSSFEFVIRSPGG